MGAGVKTKVVECKTGWNCSMFLFIAPTVN